MIGRSPYGDCVPPSPKFYNNKVDIIDKFMVESLLELKI